MTLIPLEIRLTDCTNVRSLLTRENSTPYVLRHGSPCLNIPMVTYFRKLTDPDAEYYCVDCGAPAEIDKARIEDEKRMAEIVREFRK